MEREDDHREFIEELILNLVEVLYRHEDYHNVALGFDTALELGDGRILAISLIEEGHGNN